MIHLDLPSILQALQDRNFDAKLQEENQQITVMLNIEDKQYPLFLNIIEKAEFLQFLVFIPCRMKENIFGDLSRLLHLLNRSIDLPGFGLDENSKTVFYRSVIPSQNNEIDPFYLDTCLTSAQNVCKTFSAPIEAVAYGVLTYEELITKSKEQAESGSGSRTDSR